MVLLESGRDLVFFKCPKKEYHTEQEAVESLTFPMKLEMYKLTRGLWTAMLALIKEEEMGQN